jgi:hypothetical protein
MDDQGYNKSKEHSSFFFQLVNKHLPSDNNHEEEQSLGTKECILWMIGITTGFLILQAALSLLFM